MTMCECAENIHLICLYKGGTSNNPIDIHLDRILYDYFLQVVTKFISRINCFFETLIMRRSPVKSVVPWLR